MKHRMFIAVAALLGLMLSTYLTLYHAGMVGSLACGRNASCEQVQLGPYGTFLGLPVAAFGVAGYGALMAVALIGLQPRYLTDRRLTGVLVVLSAIGVAFTVYLKYLEFFRIQAVCRWCVASAILIAMIGTASVFGLKEKPSTAAGS